MDWKKITKKVATVDNAKTATSTITGIGIHEIISGIVATNVPKGNILKQLCVIGGKLVIASMINTAATKHTDDMIDKAVDFCKKLDESIDTEENNG